LKPRSARWHTIYSVISTLIETIAIIALLIWILPVFGINFQCWLTATIVILFLIYSYIMYRIGHQTVVKTPINTPDKIVGKSAIVDKDLNPEGYIKVNGELWKAISIDGPVSIGERVTVIKLDGMVLTVTKSAGVRIPD